VIRLGALQINRGVLTEVGFEKVLGLGQGDTENPFPLHLQAKLAAAALQQMAAALVIGGEKVQVVARDVHGLGILRGLEAHQRSCQIFVFEFRLVGSSYHQWHAFRRLAHGARLDIVEVARALAWRIASIQTKGDIPGPEAPALKVFGSELLQRIAQTGMQMLGLYGQLEPDSKWAPLAGAIERLSLVSVSRTIAAGTSEIQRTIMAERGLGLPRSAQPWENTS
jgi:Acyl-CoA dehydrogenase, C-terminal domain